MRFHSYACFACLPPWYFTVGSRQCSCVFCPNTDTHIHAVDRFSLATSNFITQEPSNVETMPLREAAKVSRSTRPQLGSCRFVESPLPRNCLENSRPQVQTGVYDLLPLPFSPLEGFPDPFSSPLPSPLLFGGPFFFTVSQLPSSIRLAGCRDQHEPQGQSLRGSFDNFMFFCQDCR